MPSLQLELNLWERLQEAEAEPMAIDFQQLCLCFDVEMEAQGAQREMLLSSPAHDL